MEEYQSSFHSGELRVSRLDEVSSRGLPLMYHSFSDLFHHSYAALNSITVYMVLYSLLYKSAWA